MKLTFVRAAHEVTGSCHLLEAAGKNVLIDCGMEQGRDLYENPGLPIAANEVDYVLLTHAHIDHSGMIPKLVKDGFKGEIISTFATYDLCSIMLRDSAHIQEFEAEWRNRKGRRAGQPIYEPVYVMQDALDALTMFNPCEYGSRIQLCEGIEVRFTDVGHLLGSSSIEVWVSENGIQKKIVFSGDVGNLDQPIIKDPKTTDSADYVVIESTYGNRVHGTEKPDYIKEFTEVLKETFDKGGNVVVPSFAVGRTQELLYFIREIKEKRLLPEYQEFEVYIDSPLAIEATKIFNKNMHECFDEEALALVNQGINPLIFPGLKTATTSDDSKMINFIERPKVIISASGMCEAGRIRHHLKHNLWRAECTILFVGYQAQGTLGRRLLEGERSVKLFGEPIEVRARIESLKGISGHADMNGLLQWLSGFKTPLERVCVVHGEDEVTDEFAATIEEKYGCKTFAPYPGGQLNLATNEVLTEGLKVPVKAKKPAQKRADTAFDRLVAAGRKLMDVIYKNEQIANKDKAKFEAQILNLAEKWDRYLNE
ncbi:MAG: MBL fold metallo-hydrolase [Ruminococcus sp.]|nr:MBL fold metallo-hydrolase [Ruminococcus sp.]